jgi:hypothetical protein
MRKALIALGFLAASSLMAFGGSAAAQGFGQVPIAAAPPETPPAAPAPGAAKPAGKALAGVTVNGKKTADSGKDPDEVICKSEIPMGSRFPVKTCATRRELAVRSKDDQMETRQMTTIRPGISN